MSIKNIIVSSFAVAVFSTFAMAQGGQPGQMQKEGGPKKEGMGGQGMGMRGPGNGGPGMGMRGPGMGGPGGIDFNRLNLTDAQKTRIQALMTNAKTSREANKTQMEEFGKLSQLKREGLLTAEQGTRLTSMEAQMQTQMKANGEKMQNDILAVLTPDQKVILEQQKKDRENRMKGPREGGRGGQGGGQRGPGGPGGPGGKGGEGQKTPPKPPTDN